MSQNSFEDMLLHVQSLTDPFDRSHIWHPYTSALNPLPALKVKEAYGRTLVLEDDTKLIDAMSSWWCTVHGYNIESINNALKEQVDKLSHVMFAGLTHEPAIKLAKKLMSLVPSMSHIFYADSGSVATEVAMKMAIQYQVACNRPKKTGFLTVHAGYHGDTWNAMSVCDPEGMHTLFKQDLAKRLFAKTPTTVFPGSKLSLTQTAIDGEQNGAANCDDSRVQNGERIGASYALDADDVSVASVQKILEEHHETIGAFIIEPIVQGAGGMNFYHPKFLDEVRALCDKYDVLLILDEIATGFGRTGKLFAYEHTNITPDIMLLGKGLTAGYMTLSAALCNEKVATAISKAEPHVFMHGPTFMANPLACSVALASIDYLESYDFKQNVTTIEKTLKQGLAPALELKSVKDVRVMGAIGVIEMQERIDVAAVQAHTIHEGVWLRPMGNLLYTMPPLTTTKDEMQKIVTTMLKIAKLIDSGTIRTSTLAKEDNPV